MTRGTLLALDARHHPITTAVARFTGIKPAGTTAHTPHTTHHRLALPIPGA
jgi:hypothetical protein